jgi:formylglycine-generating enzyme required for sulfatase activity
MQRDEKSRYEGVFAVKNPEEVIRQGEAYEKEYAGAEGLEAVQRALKRARAEIRAVEACDSEDGCRDYLAGFPEGFYSDEVRARLSRFGWKSGEARGIAQPAVLPKKLSKGSEAGEYKTSREAAPMVFVPGGIFPVGTDDYHADGEERPKIYVYVASFFLDKYEVTNERYGRFLEWSRSAADPQAFSHPLEKELHPGGKDRTPKFWDDPKFNRPDQPVVGVDWFDAWAFAHWAGKTLPSEAQWEVAASCDPLLKRKLRFPWGNDKPNLSRAVWDAHRPAPVGTGDREFGASPYGARDMAGNVAEWCLDAWDGGRWSAIKKRDLKFQEWAVFKPLLFACGDETPGKDRLRFEPRRARWAVRGGSWKDDGDDLRTIARRGAFERDEAIGFRCALGPSK